MKAHQRRGGARKIVLTPATSARECIGVLTPGCAMTGLTMGQFSLLDLVAAVLEQTGAADVSVSTWTAGIRDIERAAWLLECGAIRAFLLLTDRSFPGRQPDYCAALVKRFGDSAIRSTRTHAKFAVIANDGWSIVIRSSMNLNTNPRFEQFDLDDDAALCRFFLDHIEAQAAGFDDVATAAQWAGRDAPVTKREAAAKKVREAAAARRLARLGVVLP